MYLNLIKNNKKTTVTFLITLLTLGAIAGTVWAFAGVSPSSVSQTIYQGSSYTVEKTVELPSITPKLDFLLLEDESGSFKDDIALMQGNLSDFSNGLAAQIWDGLAAEGIDFRGAVAGFIDFAQTPWGGSLTYGNDWVYTLYQDMTPTKSTWLTGIGALKTNNGGDYPEGQLAALMSAANGAAWDSDGNGNYTDPEDTGVGENPSWAGDATKVIILVTDASYHVAGDAGGWPGPTYTATVNALNAAGIHVVILSTTTSPYTSLANATGGAVKAISSNSSDIVDAVMEALAEIRDDVTWSASPPTGITVSMSPNSYSDVLNGDTKYFNETISVSSTCPPGPYSFTVTFYFGDAEVGQQTVTIAVPNNPPTADAGDDQTLEQTDYAGTTVYLDGTGSSDPDNDTLTYSWTWDGSSASGATPMVSLPLGTTEVTLTVDDGEDSDSDTVSITVEDTTDPVISALTATPDVLWPPNHKYHDVAIVITWSDVCDANPDITYTITSNEPINANGVGDGNTEPDWEIVDDTHLRFRAERDGTGTDRIYTITYTVTDASGNNATASCTVTVPHDKGKGK